MVKIRLFSFILVLSAIALPAAHEARAALTCQGIFAENATPVPTLDPRLVQEIVELPDHKEIPQSIYESFPVNEIARAIVQRVRTHELIFKNKINSAEPKSLNVFNETDIILFFWDAHIESIAEKGFLNLHESHSSEGMYNPAVRRRAEDLFTGIQLGESPQALKLRPKSAFLNIRADIDLAPKKHSITNQYGNIGAVLKPEIKNRALWIDSDSLWFSQTSYVLNSRTMIPSRGTFYRDSLPCTSLCRSYYEAVIYGEVGFADVDYFLVTDAGLAKKLKPFGRPVYKLISVFRNDRVVFQKGELLSE